MRPPPCAELASSPPSMCTLPASAANASCRARSVVPAATLMSPWRWRSARCSKKLPSSRRRFSAGRSTATAVSRLKRPLLEPAAAAPARLPSICADWACTRKLPALPPAASAARRSAAVAANCTRPASAVSSMRPASAVTTAPLKLRAAPPTSMTAPSRKLTLLPAPLPSAWKDTTPARARMVALLSTALPCTARRAPKPAAAAASAGTAPAVSVTTRYSGEAGLLSSAARQVWSDPDWPTMRADCTASAPPTRRLP